MNVSDAIPKNLEQDKSKCILVLNDDDLREVNYSEKRTTAFRQGIFYLEIPEDIRPLMKRGVEFANSFHSDEKLKNMKFEGFSGYQERSNVQIESFYSEKMYWEQLYSQNPKLYILAQKMNNLALEVLKSALRHAGINEDLWNQVTGGAVDGKGIYHFSFNHYQPEKVGEGLLMHRDIGLVTVLAIFQKGLVAEIDGDEIEVLPRENAFVINFGKAFEILINNPDMIKGAWHRVDRVGQQRISFGIFVDNAFDAPVYKMFNGHPEIFQDNYKQFAFDSFSDIYQSNKAI